MEKNNKQFRLFRRMRLLILIVRRSGAGDAFASYFVSFCVCAALLWVFEPGVPTYLDALWFLWEIATTVGLGDFEVVTFVGRAVSVVCSVFSLGIVAILTAVIVDYFHEQRQVQLEDSLTEFLDKLERLPDLKKPELERLARRIRELRR